MKRFKSSHPALMFTASMFAAIVLPATILLPVLERDRENAPHSSAQSLTQPVSLGITQPSQSRARLSMASARKGNFGAGVGYKGFHNLDLNNDNTSGCGAGRSGFQTIQSGSWTMCETSTGQSGGLTYQDWTDGDTQGWACMTLNGNTFESNWNLQSYGFVHQMGQDYINKPYSSLNFSATAYSQYAYTYSQAGTTYSLGMYGWFTGSDTNTNIVEYYIVDAWVGNKPWAGIQSKGSFTVDGSIYDIYTQPQYNYTYNGIKQNFVQWWSVRRNARDKGTVCYPKHFQKWASLGMTSNTFLRNINYYVEPLGGTSGAGQVDMWNIRVDRP